MEQAERARKIERIGCKISVWSCIAFGWGTMIGCWIASGCIDGDTGVILGMAAYPLAIGAGVVSVLCGRILTTMVAILDSVTYPKMQERKEKRFFANEQKKALKSVANGYKESWDNR